MIYKERVLQDTNVPTEYYKVKFVVADINIIQKNEKNVGDCILDGNSLYLIGTEKSFDEELLITTVFELCLHNLRNVCEEHGIAKIAFPKIHLLPEKKTWPEVINIIENVFVDTDIEILVYK